jgi:hypothetical protein
MEIPILVVVSKCYSLCLYGGHVITGYWINYVRGLFCFVGKDRLSGTMNDSLF